ncbi:hypothetical protein BC938DRAFT_480486 [Jimgerdemannia flammicorona]|uniref:Uncharacterized protein n=1 Tax=Jimgerdemannia flammicorona TaxID=994334 RepID=A0A433QIG1_9FUNG|nr:hypothetical protein BC938DRAFT_480486 [Jimgerdemannia flammicorona]
MHSSIRSLFAVSFANQLSSILALEYTGLNESQEQEIFRRVQLGVALTTAERLQAVISPMADFCRKMLSQFPDLSKIMDTRRSRPFHVMAQCLHMNFYTPARFGGSHVSLHRFLKTPENEITREFQNKIRRIMATYVALVNQSVDVFTTHPTRPGRTRFAPMEFLMFAYLIGSRPERSLKKLARDCRAMRANVRTHFKDVRSNNPCFVHMRAWIDAQLEGGEVEIINEREAHRKRAAPSGDMDGEDEEMYLGEDEDDNEEQANCSEVPLEIISSGLQFKRIKIEHPEATPPMSAQYSPSMSVALSPHVIQRPKQDHPSTQDINAGGPTPMTIDIVPIQCSVAPSSCARGRLHGNLRVNAGGSMPLMISAIPNLLSVPILPGAGRATHLQSSLPLLPAKQFRFVMEAGGQCDPSANYTNSAQWQHVVRTIAADDVTS